MKHKVLLLLLSLSMFSYSPQKKQSWIKLFNGKDLVGWQPKISGYPLGEDPFNTFRVEKGILLVRYDKYDSFRNQFGALYYNKKFSDYRLRVEYRFVGETAPGAPAWGLRDSGVQYHCQPPSSVGLRQSFPVCLEYNLHGGNGKDERPVGQICTLGTTVEINGKRNTSRCTPPTNKITIQGDQWATLEIDIHNGHYIQFINGKEIIRFSDPRYDPLDEVARGLITNGNDKLTSGYISLQSNSHPIEFRTIEIMEY